MKILFILVFISTMGDINHIKAAPIQEYSNNCNTWALDTSTVDQSRYFLRQDKSMVSLMSPSSQMSISGLSFGSGEISLITSKHIINNTTVSFSYNGNITFTRKATPRLKTLSIQNAIVEMIDVDHISWIAGLMLNGEVMMSNSSPRMGKLIHSETNTSVYCFSDKGCVKEQRSENLDAPKKETPLSDDKNLIKKLVKADYFTQKDRIALSGACKSLRDKNLQSEVRNLNNQFISSCKVKNQAQFNWERILQNCTKIEDSLLAHFEKIEAQAL